MVEIKLYISRTSGNVLMKVEQDHIKRILEAKKIQYLEVDVGDPNQHVEKRFMQKTLQLSEEEMVALPPQIFKGQNYRGAYDTFLQAVENEHLFEYLDMEAPSDEVEYQRRHESHA